MATATTACGPPPGKTIPADPAAAAPAARTVADPAALTDAINTADLARLHRTAQLVLDELITTLPAGARARVQTLALISDNRLGDVNAYATCDAAGTPIVAISDGMLVIAAHLARSSAIDEVFATDVERAYLDWLSTHGVAAPPATLYPPAYHADRTKLARQRELFDEALAFVLGHELAHHYLGHLACNSADGVPGELDRLVQIAAAEVPVINQTTELAADVAAVKNLLDAGAQRAGHAWTEDGALLVIAAFNRRHPTGVTEILRAFERTHPFPHLRAPLIISTAELWRASGGHLPL